MRFLCSFFYLSTVKKTLKFKSEPEPKPNNPTTSNMTSSNHPESRPTDKPGVKQTLPVKSSSDHQLDHHAGTSHSLKSSYEGKSESRCSTVNLNNNSNNPNMKKAPGPGIDLSTMRKEVFNPKEVSALK